MNKGFTLLELLLYLGLTAAILLSASLFYSLILQSRIKNQVIAEVEQQGAQVMQLVLQTIRNTQAVNSPGVGGSGASLSLDVVDGGLDPTIFDLSGGVIRIKEGVLANVNLTNTSVAAANLNFRNISRPGTPGIIRVEFVLHYINPEGRSEYDYERNFYGSASLR